MFDIWGTGEQANLFQGNKGTGITPGRASLIIPFVFPTFRLKLFSSPPPHTHTFCYIMLINMYSLKEVTQQWLPNGGQRPVSEYLQIHNVREHDKGTVFMTLPFEQPLSIPACEILRKICQAIVTAYVN